MRQQPPCRRRRTSALPLSETYTLITKSHVQHLTHDCSDQICFLVFSMASNQIDPNQMQEHDLVSGSIPRISLIASKIKKQHDGSDSRDGND